MNQLQLQQDHYVIRLHPETQGVDLWRRSFAGDGSQEHIKSFGQDREAARRWCWDKNPKRPVIEIEIASMQFKHPDCQTCATHDYGGPKHIASTACQSGKRPHCSCDTCF